VDHWERGPDDDDKEKMSMRTNSTTPGPRPQDGPPLISAGPDPWQREHELSEAILTLLIACSRYGDGDASIRSTEDRLALIQHVTLLLADQVAVRVRCLRGKGAASAFRKALGRRGRK
jgi:hypothetical protein